MTPSPDALVRSFDLQAEWCGRLGSPLYRDLLRTARDDLAAGGTVASVVGGFGLDPVPAALPLRFMGGAHRLVLMGLAPRLGRHFPSVGGTPDDDTLADDFLAVVSDHVGYLTGALAVAPQTNEVGRAAVLLAALGSATTRDALPVRLLEIGSAGGLNLLLDRYRYDMTTWSWGPPDGPPIRSDWRGALPNIPDTIRIRQRSGCDVAPLDMTDPEHRLRLLSFIWPDQPDRFARTRRAIALARTAPPRVDRNDAADWLRAQLAEPVDGVLTVVQHSLMWQYLSEAGRTSVEAIVADAGARATDGTPLVHVAFEPADPAGGGGFVVTSTRWPGGERQRLGTAHGHAAWVEWDG